MKISAKKCKILVWTVQGLAVATLLFGLPFYFGYGNPLPFINPEYTLFDNVWLTIFPFMFLGLFLGLRYKKIGGYLVSIPVIIGMLFTFFSEGEIIWFMLVPFCIGLLNIFLSSIHLVDTKEQPKY